MATTNDGDDDGERVRFSFTNLPPGVTASSSAATATVTFDEDDDRDTIANSLDNCPQIANRGQENEITPGDSKGDACSLTTREINDLTANGPDLSNGDAFGRSVASLGDLDGAGSGAATVLAVGTLASGDGAGGTGRGAVHLLYLNSDGTVRNTVKINDNTVGGPVLSNHDTFGSSVANLGDLDGSGGAAVVLAVGAEGDDAGGTGTSANRGAVHLLSIE